VVSSSVLGGEVPGSNPGCAPYCKIFCRPWDPLVSSGRGARVSGRTDAWGPRVRSDRTDMWDLCVRPDRRVGPACQAGPDRRVGPACLAGPTRGTRVSGRIVPGTDLQVGPICKVGLKKFKCKCSHISRIDTWMTHGYYT
jgi:hypothetical protein